MKRCRTGIAERFGLAETKVARNQCHCKPGDVYGWKFAKLDADEKKNQRKFLRQHVPEVRKISQKFLKTLPRGATSPRHSRSTDFRHGHLFEEDVAHDELKEVDGLVEDIAEEIRDLHNLNQTETEVGCKLDRDNVICTNDVISDKLKWETSRTTIKHQIQRLRAQLNELKQIRKYLACGGRLLSAADMRAFCRLTFAPTASTTTSLRMRTKMPRSAHAIQVPGRQRSGVS